MEQKMREAELIAVKLVKESDRRWGLLPWHPVLSGSAAVLRAKPRRGELFLK